MASIPRHRQPLAVFAVGIAGLAQYPAYPAPDPSLGNTAVVDGVGGFGYPTYLASSAKSLPSVHDAPACPADFKR
jgi:hypothetical protein